MTTVSNPSRPPLRAGQLDVDAHVVDLTALETAATRLAGIAPADYDRRRRAEAERLGIRVGTLDREVRRRRAGRIDADASFNKTKGWCRKLLWKRQGEFQPVLLNVLIALRSAPDRRGVPCIDELAARNGVSRATIYREHAAGRLAFVKIRTRTMITAAEEDRWLREAMQPLRRPAGQEVSHGRK